MVLGFKTGPANWQEGQQIVADTGATFAEIWFRVDQAKTYEEILRWFTSNNVRLGLHHWGLCDRNIKPNLATHHEEIREATIKQIKHTIDIAAQLGCVYVNAHPGAAHLEKLSFEPLGQTLATASPATAATSTKLFLDAAEQLASYAHSKNVLLTFETIIRAEKIDDEDRTLIYEPVTIAPDTVLQATQTGSFLANDITHTAAWYSRPDTSPADIWQKTWDFSKAAQGVTRLLHVNRVVPPYNGTDSHDGITPTDFALDGLPTYEQLKSLLKLFKSRDDVYVVPEPKSNMQANYLALQQLVLSL